MKFQSTTRRKCLAAQNTGVPGVCFSPGKSARKKAALEVDSLQHELAAALAEGDPELASRARQELEALQMGRRVDGVAGR